MTELALVHPRPEGADGAAQSAPALHASKDMRYWAFLSYSHHDKAVAKRVQRQIETYRLPRRLVGRETDEGVVPARALPLFRDRDELNAGADLKASVQEALASSRWLIVICTPDSARSPWVNREIIEFKRLHGERRVLALIARGEPFASDMPGREAEECFPPALRRALNEQGLPEGEPLEPIAADMRKQGDGPHRAALKLLAGMVGVGFDDLVRRDMQRRVRWLSALAGASVLGVLVFALMAVMAVQARNEAQHQRLQAEGLIEFMLGDLRKKLEPVGRLEVLDSVGEKALAYYGAQESGKLDATALGHRSRAMHLIGEIRDLRGNPAEAQAAFEQAAQTTAKLLAQAPNDGQRIFDHAQSVFWVGYAAWKSGDGKSAEPKFQEYLRLAQRLLTINPSNLEWQAELAFAHQNLGAVRLGMGRPSEALLSVQLAVDLLVDLVKQRPVVAPQLAEAYGWQADAYGALGDYEQAVDRARRKLILLRAMPEAEKDMNVQREILNSFGAISEYEWNLGHLEVAQAEATRALTISDTLLKEDSQNLRWRADACYRLMKLASIELTAGHGDVAQRLFARASNCVANYNTSGSRGLRDSVMLNALHRILAASLASSHQRAHLAVDIQKFLDQSIPQLTAQTADRAELACELANVSLALGRLRAPTDSKGAHAAWQGAQTLLEPFAGTSDGAVLTPLAQARFYLGDRQGTQALVMRIQNSKYRHPSFAALEKQMQAVWGGITQLKPQEQDHDQR